MAHSDDETPQNVNQTWGIPGIRPVLQPIGDLGISTIITGVVAVVIQRAIVHTFAPGWRWVLLQGEVTGEAAALIAILVAAREDFGLSQLLRPFFVPRWWALGVAGGGLAFLVGGFLTPSQHLWPLVVRLAYSIRVLPGAAATTGLVVVVIAMSAFLSAAMEELLFRGIIQTGCDRLWRPMTARFVSAALFAFPHAASGWIAAAETFAVGYLFSWIRYRTDSLVLPIWFHATFNILIFTTWVLA